MKLTQTIIALLLSSSSIAVNAQQLDITITNLTQGMHYTPLIVAAHTSDVALFTLGQSASPELQSMAEGGDIAGLTTLLTGVNADISSNPAGGLLAPAQSTTTMLTTSDGNMYLSVAAMLLPTNDGFVALNSWKIPTDVGTYKVMLNAYDAGTEANDEIINGGGMPGVAGIPAAPGGNAGMGASGVTSVEANSTVHIHRGNLGDDDLTGGISDVDNTVHRWLNPVAVVTIEVK